MPSGSKKRKSSKKPKPQGDPPELDAGLEEAMANAGEDVEEATPSLTGTEGDPEAKTERGLDGNEVNGEVLQEGTKEDSQRDEAGPDHDVGGQGDPPPQAEQEPEIPAAIEAEAPTVIDPEGGTAQQETAEPQIDTPVLESEAKNNATPEEIKSEVESDAVLVDTEPVADATPDVSPDEIKPDTDIGLDEIESSKESTKLDREFEFDAAPLGSESGIDGSFVETDTKPDAALADIELEIDKAPDELDAAGAPELEIGEPLVQVKAEEDATPYIDRETNEALEKVSAEMEPETDGVPSEIKPEAAAPVDIELENEESLRGQELVTDAAPTDVETEGLKMQVEEQDTAAPADIEPGAGEAPMEKELVTDAAPIPEVEEAPAERELATDVSTTADVKPDSVDIEAEMNTAQVETDVLQDEAPREIDAALAENKTETDVAVQEFESEADAAVTELELPTAAIPVEIEPEVSAEPASIEVAPESEPQVEALVEGESEEHAEDVAAPEPEPDVKALVEGGPEVSAEGAENSAEIEARTVPPQETEPEPKPLDLAEYTSVEPLEIEPELEAEEIDKAKLQDEPSIETQAEERGSVETELYQQGFVGEVEAAPEFNPEPEVETTRGIELEAEAAAPLNAEPESAVEAPAETELDEKGLIYSEADQQDLVEIEPDQLGVKEHDEQLQNPEGEPEIGELESSVSEDNQPSESQAQIAEALEVHVVEDEPPSISASDAAIPMDDATSSTSSSEASDITDKEKTAIEPEVEESDDIPPLATTLDGEGESTVEVVSENQDYGGSSGQTSATAVDSEQGAADGLSAESKEDISEGQEKGVDVGHNKDGAVLASSGNDGETEEANYQVPAIAADVVNMEELAKEDIIVQERAVDVQCGEEGAVLESARDGGEAEGLSNEQGLAIEQSPDVVDVEECAMEETPPSDQEPPTEQPQLLIDEEDLSMGLGAAAEPPSVESEQSLNATLSSSESKVTSDAPEPLDETVTPASGENVALEHELNLESATDEPERDIGEEEAVSSTVAEVGSVLNDFDERAAYDQELPTDVPSTEQDADVPECKEFDDNLFTELLESVGAGTREQLDTAPSPGEKVELNNVCLEEATSEQPEVLLENVEAAKPANDLHSAPVEEMPSDEQVPSSPQPVQVVQDSGEDEVDTSKEMLANEKPRPGEEERATCEDGKVAANSILETSFPIVAGDELISKASIYLRNSQQSLTSSEVPRNELVEHRDELSIHQGEANNTEKAEIHTMDSKESKEVDYKSMGGEANNHADDTLVGSTPPISEGRDIKDVQVLRQESTQEASLPVVISTQDRAVEHVNLKNAERPSGGGALNRRAKLLDCCGMFDLLLRKN